MHVYFAKNFSNLSSLNNLKHLHALHFTECYDFSSFTNFRNNENLLSVYFYECDNFDFSYFLNIPKLDIIHIVLCDGVKFKTQQCYPYVENILVECCINADIEIDFALFPHLTHLKIQNTQGTLILKNGSKSSDLYKISIQDYDTKDLYENILQNDDLRTIELVPPSVIGE